MSEVPTAPFGRVLTAMVTPFLPDGALDVEGCARLARTLVDAGNDGLVVNGTTGESPTTSDEEKLVVVRTVLDAVGDRAQVVAGVGTNDTRHSIELAQAAAEAGAHGTLVVTPYYSKPPQAGLVGHFAAVADATPLPVMLYDIPGRTGVPIRTETLVELAAHERIVAVKDAKEDLAASAEVLARTDLAYYSGSDALNLPLLSVGAVGVVSVITHVVTARVAQMIAAFASGDVARAQALNAGLIPVSTGIFRTQGVILTKAALGLLGLPGGPVRSPLADATAAELAQLRVDLAAGGLPLDRPVLEASA
ncbi:dihydrodipicolinate synthase [Motilibacter rhizosphaerae]|uniref:4-hydroxy-tetrahydrodipicolinate synthase n=1 Tax=Motilibacter rhizosphaerae TaxID=598652 RepID=A0A4Q7NPD2_9ACTN|nr:4-hydroxy-tetrahydrodipicolinate synthase [Motilibacter rhizosphaerae]RZS86942.1 dihydrodipicolinate synthase [Motilibacter rhizosphaerae]